MSPTPGPLKDPKPGGLKSPTPTGRGKRVSPTALRPGLPPRPAAPMGGKGTPDVGRGSSSAKSRPTGNGKSGLPNKATGGLVAWLKQNGKGKG